MPAGFDAVAPEYDRARGPARPIDLAALDRALEGARTVLDVGGGTGRYAGSLAERGRTLTVVDRSRGMLAVARSKGDLRLVRADAARLPFPPGAFDAAYFVLLLHLVRDARAVMREVARVTRDRVVALVEEKDPDLRALYLETRRDLGFPSGRDDGGVEAFVARLPPDRIDEVDRRTEAVDPAAFFAGLEPPGGLPVDVHAAAESRVRARFGDGKIPQRVRTYVATWSPTGRLLSR